MPDDFDHEDDNHENDLPPGSAMFFVFPLAIAIWGAVIWAVLK